MQKRKPKSKVRKILIRFRKQELEIDGVKKVFIMIRDMSDTINISKMMLKQEEND